MATPLLSVVKLLVSPLTIIVNVFLATPMPLSSNNEICKLPESPSVTVTSVALNLVATDSAGFKEIDLMPSIVTETSPLTMISLPLRTVFPLPLRVISLEKTTVSFPKSYVSK